MKQKHYIAGLYYRLSQEDERQGESVSIDNQRAILRKYAEEHGFEIHGEYIDDGVSGTTLSSKTFRGSAGTILRSGSTSIMCFRRSGYGSLPYRTT